jgi:enamine deaminase RidA (YjgF/YER057c/UK114 family)
MYFNLLILRLHLRIKKAYYSTQVRQVHTNLKNILDEAGGNMQNIVKMITLLTHYDYVETYRSVRDEFFQEPYPPNTLLIVESLALPDFMVEIEAVAVLD